MVDVLYRSIVFAIFLITFIAYVEECYAGKVVNYSKRELLTDAFLLATAFLIATWVILFGGGGCV